MAGTRDRVRDVGMFDHVINSNIHVIFPNICRIFPNFPHPILPLITTFGNSISIFGSRAKSTHSSLLGELHMILSLVYKECI